MVPEAPNGLENDVTPRSPSRDSRKSPNVTLRNSEAQDVMFKVPPVPTKSPDADRLSEQSKSVDNIGREGSMNGNRRSSLIDRFTFLAPLSARKDKTEGSGSDQNVPGGSSARSATSSNASGISEKEQKKMKKDLEKERKEKEKAEKKWQKQLEKEEKEREKAMKKAAKK